jgi:hypothetical protein
MINYCLILNIMMIACYFIISASDICEDGVMIADVCVIYVVIITYE